MFISVKNSRELFEFIAYTSRWAIQELFYFNNRIIVHLNEFKKGHQFLNTLYNKILHIVNMLEYIPCSILNQLIKNLV